MKDPDDEAHKCSDGMIQWNQKKNNSPEMIFKRERR